MLVRQRDADTYQDEERPSTSGVTFVMQLLVYQSFKCVGPLGLEPRTT